MIPSMLSKETRNLCELYGIKSNQIVKGLSDLLKGLMDSAFAIRDGSRDLIALDKVYKDMLAVGAALKEAKSLESQEEKQFNETFDNICMVYKNCQ